MATKRLSEKATFVTRGYGQVEPNHLSARRTGQIYAQLPADKDIEVLENGQFAKYDYENGVVNFTGDGEWMLVLNEIKLYEDREQYEDFAMIKSNYNARVYSPIGQDSSTLNTILKYIGYVRENSSDEYDYQTPAFTYGKDMPDGTTMVPRLLKTNIGDLFTTNCVAETELALGDELVVGDDGYLTKTAGSNAGDMKWKVVKVYTLADNQPAVKIQRIA